MKIHKIGQNDTPTFNVELKDSEGNAVDISSADVMFRMKRYDGTNRVERAMDITFPGTDGKASITLTADETDVPGKYEAQIFIDDTADTTVQVDGSMKFVIAIEPAI